MGKMDLQKIADGVALILKGIGEDAQRPGLQGTPERYARMCEEIFAGLHVKPEDIITAIHTEHHDEIVLVKEIPFYSVCEHHLLPFHGVAHVAYIPKGDRIVGISKLARLVELYAKRPQVQERLTAAIADSIMGVVQPKGVLTIIEAEHLCMTMRGVKKPGALTVTSVVRGIFRENPATRAEAMALIQGRGTR